MRILVLYYSQTGQLREALDSLLSGLPEGEHEIHQEALQPVKSFPFPWNLRSFLGVFPESVLSIPPKMRAPEFDPDGEWDLVILAYTVWYLAPSLPMTGFLASDAARVLKDKPVMTLVACRNMWHTASEYVKDQLKTLGATHVDNVVVVDGGAPWATFVTTPRWMFTGRKDAFWRVFPPAGLAQETVQGLPRFGAAIEKNQGRLGEQPARPLLDGLSAVEVENRYVLPELIGKVTFPIWARIAQLAGSAGSTSRHLVMSVFVVYLVSVILFVIPITIILRLVLHPIIRSPLQAYVLQLKSPSSTSEV
jgi:hypothetical protein